jgi:hypothetical protein
MFGRDRLELCCFSELLKMLFPVIWCARGGCDGEVIEKSCMVELAVGVGEHVCHDCLGRVSRVRDGREQEPEQAHSV